MRPTHCPDACRRSPVGPVIAGVLVLGLAIDPARASDFQAQILARAMSDYIHQGYSLSGDAPTVQVSGGVTSVGGAFAGATASRVDLGGADVALAPYAGYAWGDRAQWHAQAGLTGYLFDSDAFDHEAGYAEPFLSVRFRDLLRVRASVALDAYGFGTSVPTLEAGASYAVDDLLDLDATLGYHGTGDLAGYDLLSWSLGATRYVGRRMAFDLRLHGARFLTEQARAAAHDEFEPLVVDLRLVVSASLRF